MQIPLRPGVKVPPGIKMPDQFKVMSVDWERVADAYSEHEMALAKRFVSGN
ncbi:hypothetical protein D3C83_198540 [compost metagenome]